MAAELDKKLFVEVVDEDVAAVRERSSFWTGYENKIGVIATCYEATTTPSLMRWSESRRFFYGIDWSVAL